MSPPRHPKGEPAGGQFTSTHHSPASITLGGTTHRPGDDPDPPPDQRPRAEAETARGGDRIVVSAAASRDPDLPPAQVAELMSDPTPVGVRHDAVNRGCSVVLGLAAGDPNPVIRAAAHGSPHLPAAARYALSRDPAMERLAGLQLLPAAS